MLDRIFEMFTQVDGSLEKSHGGLGIGLTIVKQLIEMHGGSVEARSEGPGKGSEFVVRLPVAASMVQTAKVKGTSDSVGHTVRRRILIADDNQDSARSLAIMLKFLGNEVQTAHDGQEAVDLAASYQPEVVLLDIGMPKLNGYDAASYIRQQPWGRSVVLIALTGWGQEEDKRRSQEAGFDYHLVKPVEPDVLKKVLKSAPSKADGRKSSDCVST
jgi:CheY-like chemotaxis protein